ncbi:thiamine phosphate synthase, partial [Candidatus Binatus sp.]|uniref:thiamine phosphate synthase n=1 Tax=Candidatus Binatus sp. TaxID=2811406 RepID=UPI003CBF4683
MTRLPSHFYAMVDPAGGHDPVSLAETLLDAGARIMQLRLKDAPGRDFLAAARTIAEMCRKRGAMLIVNDRVDIAILAEAHGVHLGQTDLPLEAARRIAGPNENKIIGISTPNVEQARAAEDGGADCIGFGPIYPGGLRNNAAGVGLDHLRMIRAAVKIP